MDVAEDVLASRLEHRPAQGPLEREAAPFRYAAGGLVAEGMAQLRAVEAQVGQGPAGGEGECAGGDTAAAGLGKDPVADAGDAQDLVDLVDADVPQRPAALRVRDPERGV